MSRLAGNGAGSLKTVIFHDFLYIVGGDRILDMSDRQEPIKIVALAPSDIRLSRGGRRLWRGLIGGASIMRLPAALPFCGCANVQESGFHPVDAGSFVAWFAVFIIRACLSRPTAVSNRTVHKYRRRMVLQK